MGNKDLQANADISEKSKKALKSEIWEKFKKANKTETMHFTEMPEIQHFAMEKVNKNDGVYGVVWGNVVKEYLMTAYCGENPEAEVVSDGITYKVLKREGITVFYDADGTTLFDVENKRLEKAYGFLMKNGGKAGENPEQDEISVRAEADRGKKTDKSENAKSHVNGETKLLAEENEMLHSVKPEFKKVMQKQLDLIFQELIIWTKQDPEFEKKVLLAHKSIKRCMKFCADKAMGLREPTDQEKTNARQNNVPIMTPVGSDMLFEWIKEYYDADDKAEAEKEKKAAADKKKSVDKKKAEPKKNVEKEEQKKNAAEKKEATKKEDVPKVVKVSKKQEKDLSGQMSMFDLFGE